MYTAKHILRTKNTHLTHTYSANITRLSSLLFIYLTGRALESENTPRTWHQSDSHNCGKDNKAIPGNDNPEPTIYSIKHRAAISKAIYFTFSRIRQTTTKSTKMCATGSFARSVWLGFCCQPLPLIRFWELVMKSNCSLHSSFFS